MKQYLKMQRQAQFCLLNVRSLFSSSVSKCDGGNEKPKSLTDFEQLLLGCHLPWRANVFPTNLLGLQLHNILECEQTMCESLLQMLIKMLLGALHPILCHLLGGLTLGMLHGVQPEFARVVLYGVWEI